MHVPTARLTGGRRRLRSRTWRASRSSWSGCMHRCRTVAPTSCSCWQSPRSGVPALGLHLAGSSGRSVGRRVAAGLVRRAVLHHAGTSCVVGLCVRGRRVMVPCGSAQPAFAAGRGHCVRYMAGGGAGVELRRER